MSTRDIARPARGCQLAVVILAIVGSLVGLRVPAMAVDQVLIVSYPLADNSDGSNGFGPGSVDNTVLADTTISAGPGLGQFSVGTDSWSGSTQVLKTGPGTTVASATASAALSNDWYFDITLTPQSAIDLRAVSADWSRGGTTATRGWFVRSSLDNYASDLYANETPVSTPTGLNSVSFDLTGFSNIATPITFRFYIYTDSTLRYMDFQNIAFYRSMPPPPPPLPPELAPLVTLPVLTTTTTVPPTTTLAPSTTLAPTTTVTDGSDDPSPSTAPPLASVLALPEGLLLSGSAVNPGESVSISIGGFEPDEFVMLVVASTPRILATGNADAQGVVRLTGVIPADLAYGDHTLAVIAPNSASGFRQAITLIPGQLPQTGIATPMSTVFLLLLVGLGVLVARRHYLGDQR